MDSSDWDISEQAKSTTSTFASAAEGTEKGRR